MYKQIPTHVEFACVVGTGTVVGDGLVSTRSQYTPDLQRQGIPAYPFNSTHWMVLRGRKAYRSPAHAQFLRGESLAL